jgi:hypothetical protein
MNPEREGTMQAQRPSFLEVEWKTIVTHTLTYFLLGILSALVFDYSARFADPVVAAYFRQTSDPLVTAGVLFQPIRGMLLGAVLFLLREPLFQRRYGWLTIWVTLVVVGVLSVYIGAPGSLEGLVYTKVPFSLQLSLLPEVLIQTLLFSAFLFYWVNHPGQKWLSWLLVVLFIVILILPALGLLFARPS